MNKPEIVEITERSLSPFDCREMLMMAYYQAKNFSDDPNTKVGAILVNPKGMVIGAGANRMSHVSLVTPENLQAPAKYKLIEHAERDAIYSAARWTRDMLEGSIMFAFYACCADCARAIGLAGVKTLVIHKECMDKTPERWAEHVTVGHDILRRMGVEIVEWSGKIGDCENTFDGKVWYP